MRICESVRARHEYLFLLCTTTECMPAALELVRALMVAIAALDDHRRWRSVGIGATYRAASRLGATEICVQQGRSGASRGNPSIRSQTFSFAVIADD